MTDEQLMRIREHLRHPGKCYCHELLAYVDELRAEIEEDAEVIAQFARDSVAAADEIRKLELDKPEVELE